MSAEHEDLLGRLVVYIGTVGRVFEEGGGFYE
jgi:hypothetical protein